MRKIVRYLAKLPLYTKIFIGFALGILWGLLFNIPKDKLDITYFSNQNEISQTVSWDKFIFSIGDEKAEFGKHERNKILNYFKKHSSNENLSLKLYKNDKLILQSSNIKKIEKVSTWATRIKWIGNIFMRLLSFLAIPLVLASLIVGAASLEDIRKLERIGIRALVLYLFTTVVAIVIGLALANIIQPGNHIDKKSTEMLMSEYESDTTKKIELSITDYIENIVPKNPFRAIATEEMLQIVFFAIFFGVAINYIPKERAQPITSFFTSVTEVVIKMVDMVMKIAPFGVFALIAATISDFGFDILKTLAFYIFTVILGLTLQIVLVYFPMVKYLGKYNPFKFFKDIRVAQLVALSTSSSAATLPVTMECVEQNIGVPKKISGFVLPLGATINMDGTALYQGVAAVFIAQVYGMDLTIYQQLTVVLTAVLASIGTAPVPGVGILMLIIILNSINVPAEGIALILGVDRLLDMCRTVPNITGDAAVAVSVWGMTDEKAE